ncbi:galectin-3b isoform 2-T3 [Symphorus nematophorus]
MSGGDMNLEDALGSAGWPSGGNNQPAGGGVWPSQPNAPTWPGPSPGFPGGPSPSPGFPGGSSPSPGFPGGPSPNPGFPGGPSPNPTWPSGGGGGGAWPSPQPSAPGGGWPSPGGPGPAPGPGPGPGPGFPAGPQLNLAVPFHHKLPTGVYDKLLFTIAGTIKPNADKFTLDLSSGKDIAFHFNPRFNDEGRKVIVRNSFINKEWGKEERELTNFPFVQGKNFEMKILCTNTEYKVAVNGAHLLTFRHRFRNLSSIHLLAIYYDVTLSKFTMETIQ